MPEDLERVELLLDLGRPAQAEEAARLALAQEPGSAEAAALLARALLARGEDEQAFHAALAVVRAAPYDEHGHRLCSIALSQLGRHDEALRAAEAAVRCDPSVWLTHLQHGAALLGLRGRKASRAALQAAAEAGRLAPHEADPHFLGGLAHLRLGRKERARRAYEEALLIEPGHAGALAELAGLLTDRSRMTDAGRLATAGLASSPQDPELRRRHDVILLNTAAIAGFMLTMGGIFLGTNAVWIPYPGRLVVAIVGVALAAGWAARVARALPQGLHAWPSLYERGSGLVRLLLISTVVVTVVVLVVGVLPSAGLAEALGTALLIAIGVAILLVFLLGVVAIVGIWRASRR